MAGGLCRMMMMVLSLRLKDWIEILKERKPLLLSPISYPVSDDAISNAFAMPVVRLTLEGLSSDSHWSQAKQSRLAQIFFEVAKKLSVKGIKRIHLVLAAPNSVVFTFGRRYDKRNLPAVSVYQFEGGDVPTYPWSIAMPVGDTNRGYCIDGARPQRGIDLSFQQF